MNNKKIISGAVWIVGLLVVGGGGYWYFSGGSGSGGSVVWSNGVALVESSWNEAVGLSAATSTPDSDSQSSDNQPVQAPQAPVPTPPGPPPTYSIADTSADAATATATSVPADVVVTSTESIVPTPPTSPTPPITPVPVVSYTEPSSSPVVASATVTTATAATVSSASSEADVATNTPTSTSETVAIIPTPEPTSTTSTSSPASAVSTAPTASVDHPVIVQVQIAGAASSNDFVKIFNPTGATIDLSGWKLHKKSSTGTEYSLKTIPTGAMIASGAYFTWANSENGFADSIGADVSSTETLSADNSVALMDPSETVIDAVAWGTGANQYVEGDAYPTDPTAGQILTRKSADGSVVDTDDNANDFTVQ